MYAIRSYTIIAGQRPSDFPGNAVMPFADHLGRQHLGPRFQGIDGRVESFAGAPPGQNDGSGKMGEVV